MNRWLFITVLAVNNKESQIMKNTKFVVKLSRGATRKPEFVLRIDRTPIQMTTNRKLALVMGKFVAEDTVNSLQNSRRIPELIAVQVECGQLAV
jgi:hypothetical protein